jgi:hypothetical protein
VEGGNDPSSSEAVGPEPLQGVEEGLQLGLALTCSPPALVLPRGDYNPLGVRGQPPVVVAEVEPSVLPPLVRRGQGCQDVLVHLV